jgi:hypothetical protein
MQPIKREGEIKNSCDCERKCREVVERPGEINV